MKVLILAFFMGTLFYAANEVDKFQALGLYERNFIEVLDPTYPKLAKY